jgi:hypothetical protein
MTLPGSGAISYGDIRTEMSGSGAWSLNTAEGSVNSCASPKPDGATPNSVSEWYSYNHATSSWSGRNCHSEICGGSDCTVNNGSLLFCEGKGPGLETDGLGNPYRANGSTYTSCTAPDASGSWTSVSEAYCCL